MFPERTSRETSRIEGKQNYLFPSRPDIKCFVIHPKDEQIKQTNEKKKPYRQHEQRLYFFYKTLQIYGLKDF